MKKSFFKKLSFVLALAMIMSVVAPAAGVFAASKPKLNASTKYLFLGEDDKNEFDFNVANKQSGWKYAWSSSDEKVAKVEKNGYTTALSTGKTTISVAITKAGKAVKTLKASVIVKDNIEEVKITNVPTDNKLAVGVVNDFNRSFTTKSGNTKVTTSVVRWTVTPADGATIDDAGKFTATKAGKYTVTANAFQSTAKYNDWKSDATKYAANVLATASVDVTVSASMTGVKQVNASKVNVTFDTAMTDVKKNVTVSAMIGTTKVKQLVKDVTMDTTNKVATAELYVPFAAGTTYVVDYPEMTSQSFVAATSKVADVASMQIATTSAVVGTATDIEVKLFNKENVEITSTDLSAHVTLETTSAVNSYLDATNKKATIFAKGATLGLKATFHTWNYNNGTEEGNLVATGTITGVDAATQNITGINAWTIVKAGPDFSNVKQKLAVDDAGYKLFVKFNTKTGDKADTVDNTAADANKFEFESSDPSTVYSDPAGNLYPYKEGSATIVVKFGAVGGTKTPIGTVQFTVNAKRAASVLTLSANQFTLSNAKLADPNVYDTKTLTITLKDQLGEDFDYQNYTVTRLQGGPATELLATGNRVKTDALTFSGQGATEGTYNYKVTVGGRDQYVVITVVKPTDLVAVSYGLSLSTEAQDLVASAGKTDKTLNVTLYGYSSNGARVLAAPLDGVNYKVSIDAPADIFGADIYNEASCSGSYVLSAAVSGLAMTKKPVGTYIITAFQFKNNSWVTVDNKYLTVTDTQTKPVLSTVQSSVFDEVVSPAAITAGSVDAMVLKAVRDSFDFTLGGVNVDADIVSVDAFGTASNLQIKSIKIKQTIDNTYILHTVNVGVNLTYKAN